MRKPWYNFRFISRASENDEDGEDLHTVTKTKTMEPVLDLAFTGGVEDVRDQRNIVFMIFMMFGFGALLPWNMLMNITYDYYTNYKLLDGNGTSNWHSNNFQNAMTIAAQTPNLIFSFASIFFASKGDLTVRMRVCLVVVQVMVVLIMSCIFIETSSWLSAFFVLTLLIIVALNAANGLFQNSMFGLASPFPFKYTNAIIIGQNFCGIAVTVLAMATKAISDDVQMRAMLFFGLSSIAIIACFALLYVINRFRFYRKYGELCLDSDNFDDSDNNLEATLEDIGEAFSKSKMQFANVFFLFFVTLSLFPNICMSVRENLQGQDYNFFIPEKYFIEVVVFLNFNLFAFIGSLTANWIQVPGPKSIWILVAARFWFMFYFPATNYLPMERNFPVLFESTWIFLLSVTVLAFSSGYLSSLIMMYAPRSHEEPRVQRMAGMIAAFFLIAGVVAGLVFSWPIKLFIIGIN